MTVQDKLRWKKWADGLRQEMMTSLTAVVTKSVKEIISETATNKTESTVHSARFWRACQSGTSPNESLSKAGFEIEFEQDQERNVQEVTLRLNKTWLAIMQRVLDRKVS
jgi:hypothetical protein